MRGGVTGPYDAVDEPGAADDGLAGVVDDGAETGPDGAGGEGDAAAARLDGAVHRVTEPRHRSRSPSLRLLLGSIGGADVRRRGNPPMRAVRCAAVFSPSGRRMRPPVPLAIDSNRIWRRKLAAVLRMPLVLVDF